MVALKCKYCGGNISAFPENALGTCVSCGSTMTLPVGSDPRRAAGHNCGNFFRRAGNFDKALAVYHKLLQEDPEDAEAAWCSALCRFGVQYVQDAESGSYLPVCTLAEPADFPDSGEYLAAIVHSSGAVQLQYEKEAARIARSTGPAKQEADEAPADPTAALKDAYHFLEQRDWAQADSCCNRALEPDSRNAMAYLGKLLAEFQCANPKELGQLEAPIDEAENYRKALEYADEALRKKLEGCARQIRKRQQVKKIDAFYQDAEAAMQNAKTNDDYRLAARLYGKLNSYRDSEDKAKECLRRAEIIRRESVYREAVAAREDGDWETAADLFAHIPGWKDANVQLVECRQRMEAVDAMDSGREHSGRWWKRLIAIACIAVLLGGGGYLLVTKYIIPEGKYKAADAMLAAGQKEEAIAAFQELEDYKDSPQRALDIQMTWYAEAKALLDAREFGRAAAAFGGLGDYEDSRERSRELWDDIVQNNPISAGGWYTAALRSDGMACAIGDNHEKQCEVGSWMGMVSVSSGWAHTAGLRSDGTVIVAGYSGDGRGDTGKWRNIVDVAAGQWHTVGLKSNGKVIAVGCDRDGRTDFTNWENIIAVSAGRHHTVGIRADGTAIAAGSNEFGQCDVGSWKEVKSISAGGDHTVALLKNGTVVAVGDNQDGQCQVDDWNGIVAVSAGYYHTVALRADGTVVATGYNEYGQCDVSQWRDIVAVSAGGWHTVGLKADGTIVAVGRDANDQCRTEFWDNMMLPTK